MRRELILGLVPIVAGATLHLSARTVQGEEIERWLSVGYGYLLELEGDELRVFEHRFRGDLWLLTASRKAWGEDSFATPDGEEELELSREDDGVSLAWDLTSHALRLRDTSEAASTPSDEQRADARFNLEWFCATFREHYAFFEVRGVDWKAIEAGARASLDPEASAEELFELLGAMLEPLEDAHCSLEAELPGGDSLEAYSGRPDPDPLAEEQFEAFRDLVDRSYLTSRPRRACAGRLSFGFLTEGVGYLRLDGMWGSRGRLERALDNAFEELSQAEGLVLDLRFNGGGEDDYGFLLAARLVEEGILVATKEVRSDPEDASALTAVGELRVEPSGRAGFSGPVVLLVSRYTVSAAEVFGLSMLARRPRAHIVGEASAGAFSDILVARLPNGWEVGLSNEVYRTGEGRCFEGRGLPLDFEVETLRLDHLRMGADPALEAALAWLERGH